MKATEAGSVSVYQGTLRCTRRRAFETGGPLAVALIYLVARIR